MPYQPTRINTDLSAMVDRQTGSGFGGNLLRAFGMMQQGQQANAALGQRKKEFDVETQFREAKFNSDQLDKQRAYNMLQQNLMNEQADKDALASIAERTAGNLDKLDEELSAFAPKSLFGIRAQTGFQNQVKTHLWEKKAAQTKDYFEDSARKNLGPEDYAKWVNMQNNPDTGFPGQDKITFLNERVKAKQGGGELLFEDIDIGGKNFTTVRQEGKGGFRLIPHEAEGSNKINFAKWQEAARMYRDANAALSDFKKTTTDAQRGEAVRARDAAQATMMELEKVMKSPAAATQAAPTNTPSAVPAVKFIYKDGQLVPQ